MAGHFKIQPDEKIKTWYEHIKNMFELDVTMPQYAKAFNLNTKDMSNWEIRINPWKGKYAKHRENELELHALYKATEANLTKFCVKHNVLPHRMTLTGSALKYWERINHLTGDTYEDLLNVMRFKKDIVITKKEPDQPEPEKKIMNFITKTDEINLPMPTPEVMQEAEVIEERNNIELTITKGVKVILSPEFETVKIIKIIELLKDL